ncbi:MAG TPA: hemerythrin domain-containing protein [Candidatus Eisenbacteria bacterium]|jgi:hypothetical protein|nr:hemerythrin domain-containing protein [Candidatus Eisenbacteria bacterium]
MANPDDGQEMNRAPNVKPADLLREDHNRVKELFQEFEDAEGAQEKKRIAETAIRELKIHTAIEEEIFYPAVRQELGEGDLVDEALEEHHVAKLLIEELESMDADNPKYEAKFKVLSESVKHHIEEEESEMLPKAEQADIDEIGEEMIERKQELQEEFERAGQKPRKARKARSRR